MKTKLIILSILVLFLSVAPVMAASFSDGGSSLQTALDNITTSPAGDSSVDVTTDEIVEGLDAYWMIGGTGGSISTVVIEVAAWHADNTFGVYDASDHTNFIELLDGTATTGSQVVLGIADDGSVFKNLVDTGVDFTSKNNFGYYVDASVNDDPPGGLPAGGGIKYSDTSLNVDGLDHMYAYQGVGDTVKIGSWAAGEWAANEYVLAFEDTYDYYIDSDFSDFVVMVESVSPVPVPGAVLLGILGLSAAGIKLRRFA